MSSNHYFDPCSLFPPGPSHYPAVPGISTSSVALTGPLSISSLLHLALHHLRAAPIPATNPNRDEEGLEADGEDAELSEKAAAPASARARGKRRSIEEDREPHVLILSPDRAGLRDALIQENDLALSGRRCNAELVRLLDRVEIKYLPTTAHLTYFLTTVYTSGSAHSAPSAYAESIGATTGGNLKARADPSYLPLAPTLVILHNASEYLNEDIHQRGGAEAYGSLLALFMSTFLALSPLSSPLLVLHDRNASTLQLPVIPLHLQRLPHKRRDTTIDGDDDDEEATDLDQAEYIDLEAIIQYFFEWTGRVERLPVSPTAVVDDSQERYLLSMNRSPRRAKRPEVDGPIEIEYAVITVPGEDDEEAGVTIERIS